MRFPITLAALLVALILWSGNQAAHAERNGGGSDPHVVCVLDCQDSFDYCIEHQSHKVNCDTKMNQCGAWCNEEAGLSTSPGNAPATVIRPNLRAKRPLFKPKTIKPKTIKLKAIKPKTIKPKTIKPKTIKLKAIKLKAIKPMPKKKSK